LTHINPKRLFLYLTILALIILAAAAWWFYLRKPPLEGFAEGNGRIEATEVDIATKFQGRIAEILFDEGDLVKAGQVVARMDTESLEAQLRQAEAKLQQAMKEKAYAEAIVKQRESECNLAKRNLMRVEKLYVNGNISLEEYDQARARHETAVASCAAAEAQVAEAESAIEAARAETERIKSDIDDSILETPISGRVQYRLAEPGEVIPSGGEILTIISLSDVYMTVFLPEKEVGRVAIGAEARIVADTAPDIAVPAWVSFVSPKAQFTPKEVETTSERQKLVFRVKIQIDPRVLKKYQAWVKPGIPGVAYVRLDPEAKWPENLNRFPEL
jgi:HlyD family secretion protein